MIAPVVRFLVLLEAINIVISDLDIYSGRNIADDLGEPAAYLDDYRVGHQYTFLSSSASTAPISWNQS
jgi:hypothetical protein